MKNLRSTRRKDTGIRGKRPAFSLLELIIVVVVAMILTGMLLPALNKVRENVNTVICASNQRQIGMAISMYASDHKNMYLPPSFYLHDPYWQPEELMAAYTPESRQGWDGIGILFQLEYCGAAQCFYCPNHRGSHPFSKYASQWENPGGSMIYTTYHYAGDRDWETMMPRYYTKTDSLVLLTDGLRTISDVNHRFGLNVLYGDISVRWRGDLVVIFDLLPEDEELVPINAEERYQDIWVTLQQIVMPD